LRVPEWKADRSSRSILKSRRPPRQEREEAMATFTTFTLPSGGFVQVESTRTGPAEPGPLDASIGPDRAWRDGAALVAEVGAEALQARRPAFAGADEVSVEFGANISGRSAVILLEGSAAANLKVSVKWKKPTASGSAGWRSLFAGL